MMLIITPLSGWRRQITVFRFRPGVGHAEKFDAYQKVNDHYEKLGRRDKVNITLAPIAEHQLAQWIYDNVDPTWWEILTRRTRYSVATLIPVES